MEHDGKMTVINKNKENINTNVTNCHRIGIDRVGPVINVPDQLNQLKGTFKPKSILSEGMASQYDCDKCGMFIIGHI